MGAPIIVPGSGVFTDEAGHRLRLVSCNLRNYPDTGWTATDPLGHSALGIDGVTADSTGALIVHLTPDFQGGLHVNHSVDERYVRKGIIVGLWLNPDSIGLRLRQITADGLKAIRADDPILVDANANIWIMGLGIATAPPT